MFYYSPILFGNVWVDLLKIKAENPKYGLLSLVTILTSTLLSLLLYWTNAETFLDGALIGLSLGLVITLAYAKDFLFGLGNHSKQPLRTFWIAIGYHLIALPIIGTVMMFIY